MSLGLDINWDGSVAVEPDWLDSFKVCPSFGRINVRILYLC